MVDLVAVELDRVHERIAGRFARAEPRAQVREYMSELERKNGWTLVERASEVSPDGPATRLAPGLTASRFNERR
jgi:hypothetical protein